MWVRSLEGQFASKLRELKKELKGKLAVAKSDAARAEWKRRLVVVDEKLMGPAVPDDPAPAIQPTTVKLTMPPRMSSEKMRELGKASVKRMREAVEV